MFNAVELIQQKRDGHRLSDAAIEWLVSAYTAGDVADEQMSALAMAIYFQGLDDLELSAWTHAMIDSGTRYDLSGLHRPTVDKHSTGGVGDKITLPLTPLVAACGVAVPQTSGRGLGHTGGTLDKLEAIPGWCPDVSEAQMRAQLDEIGAVICAAGATLAPADKKLYALRDVTGTVEAIPLIASSIMSKKIAEGASGLVLDVKVGAGAFMKTTAQATELARRMVDLGASAGVATIALLTNMSSPIGRMVGNALEVAEAVEVLAGGGPSDTVELTLGLAEAMLELAHVDADPEQVLASGAAMDTWRAMIKAQGGDPDAPLPQAAYTDQITAESDGVVAGIDALAVGVASWRLGAGRARKEDPVDPAAGIEVHHKPGEVIKAGQPLFTLYTSKPETFGPAREVLSGAVRIAAVAAAPEPMILQRIA